MSSKSSQLHILKIEVAHGSDRHEISIYSSNKPTVNDLLDELENKTRVPRSNIQLIFKGQKLHKNPSTNLEQFGIFSGNRILMIGEKLNATNDALFRRILGVNKDVGLIEKCLRDAFSEFDQMESGGLDKTMINEYLPQLHLRTAGMKKDLETFLKVIHEVTVDESELPDVHNQHMKTIHAIKNDIESCSNLLNRMEKFLKKK